MSAWASGESVREAENGSAGQGPVWACLENGEGAAGVLSDEVLLRICRVTGDDPQITPEWLSRLRCVPGLVGQRCARPAQQLEAALALLAAVLGQLKQYNPTHLPFGYNGPRIQSRDWIERDTLERIGKQIVGLMWSDATAPTVATAVEHAVTESVRLGFLEQREYDAWRPGMPSGSGWRSMVAATPYGVMKAHVASVSAEPQRPQSPAASGRNAQAANGCQTVETPQAVTRSVSAGPVVKLGRPGEPCVVLGKQKKPLTDAQYAVVSALIEAGDEGLSKDMLEAVRASARRILKRLRQDADWAEVILMPGQTNGRYHIRT